MQKESLTMPLPEDKLNGVHMRHCNQGDYLGSCKYGDLNCPALLNNVLKLKEGTVVTHTGPEGTIIGEICGIATNELPVVGHLYIIKIVSRSGEAWEKYPYSCCTLPRALFQTA